MQPFVGVHHDAGHHPISQKGGLFFIGEPDKLFNLWPGPRVKFQNLVTGHPVLDPQEQVIITQPDRWR
jgi:hypothetical protein